MAEVAPRPRASVSTATIVKTGLRRSVRSTCRRSSMSWLNQAQPQESLDRLWEYRYEGAMVRYFKGWMDQLRWQRLLPFQKLAEMLLDHFDGILNYCRTKVALGVVEAINGNIKTLLRRGRGYKNLRYLLLKAQRLAATKIEFVACEKAA